MLERIIQYSIHHKLIVLLFTAGVIAFGVYALLHLPIGAVPDITNNQVQVITTSRDLATEDVEKFLTYPVELEMANLPGVTEIRSISKFGLSVVTIVFEDDMGTYLPRQLIAEKLKNTEQTIPAAFGKPFMGPISTGLGEIYQYTLEVDPEMRDRYSITDLRTMQDWIVKRQLSGIDGVVEINTWGGFLKQYEVAINPERLRSLHLSLEEVFVALEKNNGVAGGGYIEKTNQAYFIRGKGLVTSLQEVENIVLTQRNGSPVFVKDVASVGFGHANRFGAVTGNGEGEKVMGQIMMLKDANSKAVIEAVKERVALVQKSLPEGVHINGFLERSELIGKTTTTIAENLILGCLIVIFVVVLLLGNLRSGLVVASVIPLCLLFALSLMYIFGVDANLLSLGAIDFGIIIDGAVIIVEYIAYKITHDRNQLMSLDKRNRQELINKITFQGASKMMRSAVFGQLIIIIVFIPILSLASVEGKMFRPMALVFCFALIGAIIFCFTYVPVAASMFLRPGNPEKRTISSRLIGFLERIYQPTMIWALRQKALVLSLAAVLLIGSGILFSQMGGEFVPTLDEGDFVIQPVFKTGTSLSSTIAYSTRIESILKTFPEVDQVVSRIGAAEVPTDPMSMEEIDVIIKLKPISQWVTASNKDELANAFKEALSVIPGVDYEFTQPIEMRFNELITGTRSDLAIKVFGEDLEILAQKGQEIEAAIQHVEGAADITVEKTEGLPQMSVEYDREMIAKYGLNIEDLNNIITMGFAGKSAGTVFEGEKQFDLVVRYDKAHRVGIEDLELASVTLPDGQSLPLSEFAEITYTKGPAKISRDDTKRRVVVGVNVRNRDLESVVKDVQAILEKEISLPPGYEITYGGQFENLRSARSRLMAAVPVALLLIFVLLYFAFGSVKEALMIYSAIPLSAVGGVLLLWARDLPFSISAGVGFIALFGIAVLNGIVLIEHFKELKAHGMTNINKRIILGTQQRLRPVLLTAAAAALGFLPMALSTSAGAEVQRPLATVVIGGLISATALTLLVLPVLYALLDRKGHRPSGQKGQAVMIGLLLFLLPVAAQAQERSISMEEAIAIARENNAGLKASSGRIEENIALLPAAVNLDKTEVYYQFDQNNIAENGIPIRVLGLSQSIQFPTVYGAQKAVQQGKVTLSRRQYALDERALSREVAKAYQTVRYWQQVTINYRYLDSLFSQFAHAARRRYETGETNYLEHLTASARQQEITLLLSQSQESVGKSFTLLRQWMQNDSTFVIPTGTISQLSLSDWNIAQHPGLQMYVAAVDLSDRSLSLERKKRLPDLNLSVFQGSNNGVGARTYTGFQAGIAIPLWYRESRARIDAAQTRKTILGYEADNYEAHLDARYEALMADMTSYQSAIDYYETEGQTLSRELLSHANTAYQNGEIDFLQYVQLLEQARSIELSYLDNLYRYNMTVLEANYLMN